MELWGTADSPRYRRRVDGRGCKAVFDPDLEQGGDINVVVRRDPPPET
jgi:hypothetical protein